MHRLLLFLLFSIALPAWSETNVTLLVWFESPTHSRADFERYVGSTFLTTPLRSVFVPENVQSAGGLTEHLLPDDRIAGLLVASEGESRRTKRFLEEANSVLTLKNHFAKELVVLLDVCAQSCGMSYGLVHRAEDLRAQIGGVEKLWVWAATNDFSSAKDMQRQSVILSAVTSAEVGAIAYQFSSSATVGILSALISWLPSYKLSQKLLVSEPMPNSGTLVRIDSDGLTNLQLKSSQLDLNSFPDCVKVLGN